MTARIRVPLAVLATLAMLTLLHLRPWRAPDQVPATELAVGYLPVTCHLTCPVTDYATRTTTTSTRFVSQRFTDFPTVVESLKTRKVDATFLLAPLAMVLREQGVPIHIVYLGHRDGSTVIVPKRSTARTLRDLQGKTFARPSRFSNQYLVIAKLMEDEGMRPGDITFVDMAPPDMPSALAAGAIDAYFVGEPFAAKAELAGTGRVLYHAKDIWPHFISCVLVVRDELIAEHPQIVRDLVRGIAESGEWAERNRLAAARLVARTDYYNQDRKLLEFVLTQPPDRVSYRQLDPSDEDMRTIMRYAIRTGILRGPIDLADLVDRRFIPEHIQPIGIAAE
ncbi:MAG TPA: ABC transporter substrate-binding protein [Kofleriaceae bacterium]|jgi:NitT/TauT family transport system substrate-binding protein|nr:ABC transporter substrate-binding protein [Kofleriaceae bacterium]